MPAVNHNYALRIEFEYAIPDNDMHCKYKFHPEKPAAIRDCNPSFTATLRRNLHP